MYCLGVDLFDRYTMLVHSHPFVDDAIDFVAMFDTLALHLNWLLHVYYLPHCNMVHSLWPVFLTLSAVVAAIAVNINMYFNITHLICDGATLTDGNVRLVRPMS